MLNPPEFTPEPEQESEQMELVGEEYVEHLSFSGPYALLGWDTETFRFRPGVMAPEHVCSTYHWADTQTIDDGRMIVDVLRRGTHIVVGQNIAYDLAVLVEKYPDSLPDVFRAYDEGRIRDTRIRQIVLDIAAGEYRKHGDYSLAQLFCRHHRRQLPKDRWRTEYSRLASKPFSKWPEGALAYAKNDATATLMTFCAQGPVDFLAGEEQLLKTEWALHLVSIWGVRTDENFTETYRRELQSDYDRLKAFLETSEPQLIDKHGKKRMRVARAYIRENFRDFQRTASGEPSVSADALSDLDDPLLDAFSEIVQVDKKLKNDIKLARRGEHEPIHTRYGLAGTFRTTSSPNLQNLNRKSKIRECFVARPDRVFSFSDYGSLELHTFAQVITDWRGRSEMAELLNRGAKIHSMVAGVLLGCSWQEVEEGYETDERLGRARQIAKERVYGGLGLMGHEKFIKSCKKKGLIITEQESRRSADAYEKICSDVPWYFSRIRQLERGGKWILEGTRGEGTRICDRASQAANTTFQRLAAYLARHAVDLCVRETLLEPSSPLYGSRIALFIHDEICGELRRQNGTAGGLRIRELMLSAGRKYCPDCPPGVSGPDLCLRWKKGYKSKRQENGELSVYGEEINEPIE